MIAACVDNFFFRSKIEVTASATGAVVSFLRETSDPSLAGAHLALIDLDAPTAVETVAALSAGHPGLKLIGFVSHVNADRIRDAKAAGHVQVVARSAFIANLPSLLR